MNKTAYVLAFVALAAVGASIAFVGEPATEPAIVPVGGNILPPPAPIPAQNPNFRGPGDE